MPPRRVSTRVTKKTRNAKPPTTFHSFPLLPPEIRQQIWSYALSISFVLIKWNPTLRRFTSTNRPPPLLSTNHESRSFGLKHYTLSFGSSPEFARVYFNFKQDILYVDWESLGPAPGRLGRKFGGDELGRVGSLLIHEATILEHAEEDMRELSKFTGLENIAVICDKTFRQSGQMFGAEEMGEYGEALEGGMETWPRLLCFRDRDEDEAPCSRHWWFEGWNRRALAGMKVKWPGALSDCLQMTLFGEDEVMWGFVGYGATFA
jgi:hypothetical protein